MKTLTTYCIALITATLCVTTSLQGQVYHAANGSFILFDATIQPGMRFEIKTAPLRNESYTWPSGQQEFIRRYREAQSIFGQPVTLSDEQLSAVFAAIEESTGGGSAFQVHPTLLIALGHAAYTKEQGITELLVEKTSDGKPAVPFTLTWVDHRITDGRSIRLGQQAQDDTDIELVLRLPGRHWIDSAKVTKQVVGSQAAETIRPILLVSSIGDSTVMQLWDTSRVIGEFIYTITPHDKLGVWHASLPGWYAHNYTQQTASRITDFTLDMVPNSKSVKLTWATSYKERVRGFAIFRAAGQDALFQHIADVPATEASYVDAVRGSSMEYFYYVQVMDQFGPGEKSIIRFVVPEVKEKPAPPATLFARPVAGGVEVSWPTHDGFHNTHGYYVYRQSPDRNEWEQVSALILRAGESATWTDTSRFLKPEIEYAYAVRAESTSFIQSELSTPAYARPQIARNVPVPAVPGYRFLENGQLMVYWDDMRTADPYITAYHLFETDNAGKITKEVTGSPFDDEVLAWQAPEKTVVAKGYVLLAADAWGNKSVHSRAVHPQPGTQHSVAGPIILKPMSTGNRISWGVLQDPGIKSVQLYETPLDGKPSLLKSLPMPASGYTIPKPKMSAPRSYYITYKFVDGTESAPSEAVIVQ